MLRSKDAQAFFVPFARLTRHVTTIPIEGEPNSFGADDLYDAACTVGIEATPADGLGDAMMQVSDWVLSRPGEGLPRILICGSLYLAGQVLAENE
jgi:dihydrofolate synthase/folylpolyglutamate synthase